MFRLVGRGVWTTLELCSSRRGFLLEVSREHCEPWIGLCLTYRTLRRWVKARTGACVWTTPPLSDEA